MSYKRKTKDVFEVWAWTAERRGMRWYSSNETREDAAESVALCRTHMSNIVEVRRKRVKIKS